MTDHAIDPNALRRALGNYATGVTVVTTRSHDGERAGLTVNSFSSVSLSPPLVLWSLARSAVSFDIFEHTSHFAINVLAENQIHLAEQFAKTGGDKFVGVNFDDGTAGVPLLHGAAARFVCRNTFRYPGGDHLIFVGEVIAHEQTEHPLLVYTRGGYRSVGEGLQRPNEMVTATTLPLQKKSP